MEWNVLFDYLLPAAIVGLWADRKRQITKIEEKLENKVSKEELHTEIQNLKTILDMESKHVATLFELIREDLKEIKTMIKDKD